MLLCPSNPDPQTGVPSPAMWTPLLGQEGSYIAEPCHGIVPPVIWRRHREPEDKEAFDGQYSIMRNSVVAVVYRN